MLMSIDATSVRYKCPFCEVTKPSLKAVREHVTETEDSAHIGHNGYTMSQTIQQKEELDIDVESEREMHQKIKKAAQYFDDMDNDAIAKIAEEADVPKNRVVRVFEDEGIIFSFRGRKPISRLVDMSSERQKLMKEYQYEDDRIMREVLEDSGADLKESNAKNTIQKYKWLKLPIYDGDKGNSTIKNGEVKVEDTADEMLEQVKEENKTENMTLIDKLEDAGVDYTVEINEDDFDAIAKLIKAGYEDLARERFDE